jgi:hypothetical protein
VLEVFHTVDSSYLFLFSHHSVHVSNYFHELVKCKNLFNFSYKADFNISNVCTILHMACLQVFSLADPAIHVVNTGIG